MKFLSVFLISTLDASGQVSAPITVHRVKVRMDGTQMAVDFTGTTTMLVLI
jgi:hypothetical protein